MSISKTAERAGGMGSSTLGVARSASDRARSTAAGGLARAGNVVQPTRRRGRRSRRMPAVPTVAGSGLARASNIVQPSRRSRGPWSRRMLVVPALAVAVALAAAAMRRRRSGAGSAEGEPAGQTEESAARPASGSAVASNGVTEAGTDRTALSG